MITYFRRGPRASLRNRNPSPPCGRNVQKPECEAQSHHYVSHNWNRYFLQVRPSTTKYLYHESVISFVNQNSIELCTRPWHDSTLSWYTGVVIRPETCVAIRPDARKFFTWKFLDLWVYLKKKFFGFVSVTTFIRPITRKFRFFYEFKPKIPDLGQIFQFLQKVIFADLTFIRPITQKFMK